MTQGILPIGKLPADLLARLLSRAPCDDPRLLVKPGLGLDCAVIDMGPTLLVCKSDPITFATDEIGWYAVQVNANDIATSGAAPRWFMPALLLPEGRTTPELVELIGQQIHDACRAIGVTVAGGHTEITHHLDRPIVVGTMLGEVERDHLVTPRGATPGDRVLLTKGVPIEATAILSREFPDRLRQVLSAAELSQACDFLHDPGIGVLRDARIATEAGRVTAMHDPTEGGLATALWELAEAAGCSLEIDPTAVPVPSISLRVCQAFDLDPMASIASGALLLTAPATDTPSIRHALEMEGLACAEIGAVMANPVGVWLKTPTGCTPLLRPQRDEIARVYEQ